METSRASSSSDQPKSWDEYEQLNQYRYSKVNWREIINLATFVSSCSWRECRVDKINGNPCPFRCQGCKAGRKRLIVQAEYRIAEEARQKAADEAKALNDRAEEENPGLYSQNKLWLPHAPGVALIRGHLLADIANFFSECDFVVHEHNEPATNLSLKAKGADIAWAFDNDRNVRLVFMGWSRQVRVQIVKFHPPSDYADREFPLQGVLHGMHGAFGAAMCKIITFLGSTGELEKGNIDNNSSYWFHSASGLKDKFMDDIGNTSFRMVRVPKMPVFSHYELMLRFGLGRGKERAKHFADNCEQNVKEWKVGPTSFQGTHWGSFENVPVERSERQEPQASDWEDSSEDSDVGNLSDVSGSTDQSGMPLTSQEKAAIQRRRAERAAQARAEARAALQTRLDAQAASEEELPMFYCQTHRRRETRDEHMEKLAKSNAAVREKRLALQAAWELEQAEALAREKRLAEAIEVADESQTESGETTRGEMGDSEDSESRLESLDTMDVEEEEDSEGEPRIDTRRFVPEYLRQGGEVQSGPAPLIVISDGESSPAPSIVISDGESSDEP